MEDTGIPRGEHPVPLSGPIDEFRFALYARTPHAYGTPLLIALNAAVFVAMVASGVSPLGPTSESLLRWGADFGPKTTNGQPWRLLTNTFVHIGVFHIGMNMLGLWQIGRLVERLLGNLGFIVAYVLAGLAGSLLSTVSHPFTVSAGASGAVFGLYGALIAYLVRQRGQIPTDVLRSLQRAAVGFVALNVVFGLRQKGIDMAAHIGGLGGGLVVGLFVARPLTEDPRLGRRRAVRVGAAGLVLVAIATLLLPKAVDLAETITAFQIVEREAVAAYNEGVERITRDRLPDDDLARIIDEKVLPPWRQFRRRLLSPERLPREQRDLGRELILYVDAREKAWTRISAALHEHDRAAIVAANRELHDALDQLVLLNRKGDPE